MKLKELNTVYFLGAGGIGMSALARYFNSIGCQVFGYDKTKTELTEQLEKEGITIHYNEDVALIPASVRNKEENTLVVYTPAIPKNNKEYQFLLGEDIPLKKRSEVLGMISEEYFTIAIAGTHGKTTTSSIVAHVLNQAGIRCLAFLGGISLNFNSNLLLNDNADVVVVEADEFDRSFLTLYPNIALVTSVDADHLDVYGDKDEMLKSYQEFVGKVRDNGVLITKPEIISNLKREGINNLSYSLDTSADYIAAKVEIIEGNYVLDVATEDEVVSGVKIGLPGIHNVENSLGAYAIAKQLDLTEEQILKGLETYKGVKRRFEYHVKSKGAVYIDDYAHHPEELKYCISSVKELYPNKRITGIFQPHLFSRTNDFYKEFAQSLSLLDELILMDIYPARELPIVGVTSQIILDEVTISNKKIVTKDSLLKEVKDRNVEVLITMGAGDIDVFVSPIKEMLQTKLVNANA
ncbi:UDP-N-acetylmuramate--L-alanine ligase [bacterium]|nr:UDP-N-acetylmuramate--L-alanine ligase [bacterium]